MMRRQNLNTKLHLKTKRNSCKSVNLKDLIRKDVFYMSRRLELNFLIKLSDATAFEQV